MKERKFSTMQITGAVCMSMLLCFGCSSKNPTDPDPGNNNSQDNAKVNMVSSNSVNIYNNVSSFKQITDFIQNPNDIVDLEIPEVENPQAAISFAKSMQRKSFSHLKLDSQSLQKSLGAFPDSVIWDVTERDEEEGVTYRVSLIYIPSEGHGRLFIVGFDYPETHPLTYDSTEILVDLNFTLLDDSDDVLLSLYNLKRFKANNPIHEEVGTFTPDAHAPGTEPTGGVLTSEITYSSSSFISQTNARFEFHEDTGGSYSKVVNFSDNSTHSESVTFALDGTGTFEESRRDGTGISGTFDSAEEDGVGSYSQTTTFPQGHDPVSATESGNFTINADSTISGTFESEEVFADGSRQSESVEVSQTAVGDIVSTTLTIESSNDGSGFITIVENSDVTLASGEWTNEDETFLVFSSEYYSDESAHLEFKLYASEASFENEGDPIATGVFDFYPDGSGRGTVTEGDKTYEVIINADGSVIINEIS